MSHFTAMIGCLLTIVFLRLPAPAQQNVINTVIGGGPSDMPAVAANLYLPVAVALDNSGNYYIAAFYQNRVFKVDTNGKLTVLAGTGIAGYSGDGVNGGAPHVGAGCGEGSYPGGADAVRFRNRISLPVHHPVCFR